MDEDAFLINVALGTDLLTSAAGASENAPTDSPVDAPLDDGGQGQDKPPRSGCLPVMLAAVAIAWLLA